MKVTLIIPTLNEVEGMKKIMPRIEKSWLEQIIILDGGSSDGTVEYANEKNYFVYTQKKPGLQNAYREVLPYVKGDYLLTFSPDGNSIPELIPSLINKSREGYDMVIASRYLDDAKSEDDDFMTAFGNWLFNRAINLFFGSRYTDAMVIFRIYKKQIIHDLDLDKNSSYTVPEKIFFTKISWEPLLSVRAAKRKLKVAEIPGDEPKRIGGQRKLQIFRWGAAYLFQIFRERIFWK